MSSRRLLLISYHFPPSSEVAGKPTARLVRHLPKYGWDPVVLTIPASDVTVPIDESGYADVLANARIEHVSRWPYFNDVALGFRSIIRSARFWKRSTKSGAASTSEMKGTSGQSQKGSMGGVLASYVTFPDPRTGWVVPAILRARQLLEMESFDAIMTVSPPHSAQLIGLGLRHRRPRLPWIAQLHDPWYFEPEEIEDGIARTPDRLQRWLIRHLERRVVRGADLVLLATEESREAFGRRYPECAANRFETLYNGYDPADFPSTSTGRRPSEGPIRFLYTGALYWRRTPLPLFTAVADLIARGVVGAEQLSIELIGDCEVAAGQSVRKLAADLGLAGVVNVSPPIPYPEALERISRADVLLLFAQGQPKQVPAKVFEYLHTNKPILAFTDGATARVIRESNTGHLVKPGDNVTRVLTTLIDSFRKENTERNGSTRDRLAKYQADSLAAELANRLTSLVMKSKARGGSVSSRAANSPNRA